MRAMNAAIVILSLAAIACSASAQRTPSQKVFLCYWASWSHYRVGNGKFSAKQMESTPCTHLIYAYAKIVNGVIAPMDPHLEIQGNGMYRRFNALKRTSRDLKTLISVGGWTEGSRRFSKMASSQRGRRTFVDSVESFLDRHGFDGIDIDWRYPTQRGGSSEDKENFALLLEDLRGTMDKKHRTLTVTVPALKQTISAAYDVSELSKHVDFMSVTAFDLFGPWNSFTGHPAPLRGRTDDSSHTLNVETSIENWISEGVDVSKLVLGMPLYGRTYTLEDPSEHGFNAPTSGPGKSGPFTKEAGMLGYNEICTLLSSRGWDVTRDPDVNAPVMVKGDQWIGFDDAGSLTKKVELALQKGLAGAMVWSIDTDDFRGQCGWEKYPLLEAIRKALKLNTDETDPRTRAPTGLPCKTETREKFTCTKEGFFSRPVSDRRYIQCVKRGGRLEAREMECPSGTVFDEMSAKTRE
ncbi:chitinase-3-like protein 1 [Ixodes scapularis]